MKYLSNKANYNKYPEHTVKNNTEKVIQGSNGIANILRNTINNNQICVLECYPGVSYNFIDEIIKEGIFDHIVNSEDIFYDENTMDNMLKSTLTKDRVRGVMYYGNLRDFVDNKKLSKIQSDITTMNGSVLIYGVGSSIIANGDILLYADISRWEIQLRYRKGMANFRCNNHNEDILKKYKRGYFFEWRVADKLKKSLFQNIDYYIDANIEHIPKMITGKAIRDGLNQLTQRPFRLVPYFDKGVWGGQWMKEVCDLDPEEENYAWSFDGVPEENSLYLRYSDSIIETPAINLVHNYPIELLGRQNYARFGAEFPIRFDFLDTMEGQNLSLQVHPLTEYIKSQYGMTYTQDESYYILDAGNNGGVYLGLKENTDSKMLLKELREAQTGDVSFDVDKYINLFPAKKHDHFLIPAGTIHCSTSNCMVLEISATPYIFTFKLWDWDRVGLDGLPRPIHIDDGEQVIQWDRTTTWVENNLVNNFEYITNNDEYLEIKTGLHELEFIETRVITSNKATSHNTNGNMNMLNLVEGQSIIVESPSNSFEPYIINYVETFIIPASVGEYIIRPMNDKNEYKVLKAYVRH